MSVFAIDYDRTFTADPEAFRSIVDILTKRGHTCVCVTGRSDEGHFGAEVKRSINGLMPIVFTAGVWKREAAEHAGFKVDIWIDDMPEGIAALRADFLAVKEEFSARARAEKPDGAPGASQPDVSLLVDVFAETTDRDEMASMLLGACDGAADAMAERCALMVESVIPVVQAEIKVPDGQVAVAPLDETFKLLRGLAEAMRKAKCGAPPDMR